MNSVATTLPSASARRIVEVAERLFALHGIDGVSLRQIAAAAGTANNSAVNYHFGSKEGLIAAIFQYRLPQLTSERKMLAARCDPDDLRSRFEAYYLPVLHIAEATDNHYVSFVEQLQRRWVGSGASAASTGMLPNLPTRRAAFHRGLPERSGTPVAASQHAVAAHPDRHRDEHLALRRR